MRLNPRSRAALSVACLAAVSALAFPACGSSIDEEDLQNSLAEQLAPQGGVDPDEISVDCPADEENEEGNSFECTLTAPNGDEVPVRVEITGEDSYEAEVLAPDGN